MIQDDVTTSFCSLYDDFLINLTWGGGYDEPLHHGGKGVVSFFSFSELCMCNYM